jgi:hypothetical protein
MEYTSPVKLPDGRYYVKVANDTGARILERNVKLGEIQEDMVLTLNDVSQINSFDDKIISNAVEHSAQWFQREITHDVIKGYYQSALDDNILQCIPNLSPKGKIAVAFFSDAKETLTKVDAGTVCTVLLQLDGIWFLKKSFGPVWKLVQVRVKRQAQPIPCLIEDEDSD